MGGETMNSLFVRIVMSFLIGSFFCSEAIARRVMLPPGSFRSVKEPEFGAKGNGIDDDAGAIGKAIMSCIAGGQTLYFPAGTYLLDRSSTLPLGPTNMNPKLRLALIPFVDVDFNWRSSITLMGEDQDNTIIKLRDNLHYLQDTTKPLPIFLTASHDGEADGSGDKGMRTYIENMTIDVGRGNPGAIGVDFVGSNLGGMRDVLIQSEDPGSGWIGLKLDRGFVGPLLFMNVSVRGFKKGVVVGNYRSSVVFDNLWLLNQGIVGITNDKSALTIRNLTSYNSVPVFKSEHPAGLLTLLGGYFRSGISTNNAIVNKHSKIKPPGMDSVDVLSGMYLRDIDGIGSWFGKLVENGNEFVETGYFREFVSHRVRSAFPSSHLTSLWLPVSDPVRFESANPNDWTRANFGTTENRGHNMSDSLQTAIDTCTTPILWLSPGKYVFQKTVRIRGKVKKIIGTGVTLVAGDYFTEVSGAGQPLFHVDGPDVTIENFVFGNTPPGSETQKNFIYIQQNGSGTLFLKDLLFNHEHAAVYKSTGPNRLFIENVSGQIKDDESDLSLPAQWSFSPGQKIWARQFNVEGQRMKILNNGADLWIMGYKSEGNGTEIKTINGGRTELLGGCLFPWNLSNAESQVKPAFIDSAASISLVYRDYARKSDTVSNQDTFPWRTHVQETRGTETRFFKDHENVPRYLGNIVTSLVPLYSGH
jgi:pectate lyase-like protein